MRNNQLSSLQTQTIFLKTPFFSVNLHKIFQSFSIMGILKLAHHYTPAEYFSIDESSEFRYQYIDGEIFAMAGGSMNHNELSGNLYTLLRSGIKQAGKKCKTFMSDIRLYIGGRNIYYYPDVMVTCSETDIKEGRNAQEAILVAEVLSDSTKSYDLSDKLFNYMQVPSLQYYLIIEQDKVGIYFYERTEKGWLVQTFDKPEQEIALPLLSLSISVQAIYENIVWE